MFIEDFYGLPHDVPFINVDTHEDTPLWVQEILIRDQAYTDPFAQKAHQEYASFGNTVLGQVQSESSEDHDEAKECLSKLGEPPETRLGYSPQSHKGKGISDGYGHSIFESLQEDLSQLLDPAVGLQFSELPCFVPGIDKDRTSDLTTSIICDTLIDYTQHMIEVYPEFTAAGHKVARHSLKIWTPIKSSWGTREAELPIAGGRPLLLVPKKWASKTLLVGAPRYYGKSVLDRIQEEHTTLDYNGNLMKPSKEVLRGLYPHRRSFNTEVTCRAIEDNDNIINKFRKFVDESPTGKH